MNFLGGQKKEEVIHECSHEDELGEERRGEWHKKEEVIHECSHEAEPGEERRVAKESGSDT
jgi:hypothetical protein